MASAWVAASWLVVETLLTLMTTYFFVRSSGRIWLVDGGERLGDILAAALAFHQGNGGALRRGGWSLRKQGPQGRCERGQLQHGAA